MVHSRRVIEIVCGPLVPVEKNRTRLPLPSVIAEVPWQVIQLALPMFVNTVKLVLAGKPVKDTLTD